MGRPAHTEPTHGNGMPAAVAGDALFMLCTQDAGRVRHDPPRLAQDIKLLLAIGTVRGMLSR